MKLSWLIVVLVGCSSSPQSPTSPAQPPVAKPEPAAPNPHAEILGIMERYLVDPEGASRDEIARIIKFVTESSDVKVSLDEHVMPWMQEAGIDKGVATVVMSGYIAGDAAAQLRTRKKGSDLRAGTRGAIKVYRVMKAKRPSLSSPSLDKLSELEVAGTLDAHLETVDAARK